jgi:hypothetical protein
VVQEATEIVRRPAITNCTGRLAPEISERMDIS